MKNTKHSGTNSKKVAILTLCDNRGPTNYGQLLQCYAMVQLFAALQLEPFVVLYRKKEAADLLSHTFSVKHPLGRLCNTLYETYYKEKVVEGSRTLRLEQFRTFIRRYIPHTSPCYTREMVEAVTKEASLLVCGSDQIWNPLWTDPVWQLDFGRKEQRRIAFAPSGLFYEDAATAPIIRQIAHSAEQLDYIALREEVGARLLRKYTDRPITTAPDPTLLLPPEHWNRICSRPLIEGDYIFCYTLGSMQPYAYILRKILEQFQCEKILYIPSNLVAEGIPAKMEPFSDGGPAEFLSLIRHAKAVCTDSFHGMVFSILYEKPFFHLERAQKAADKLGGAARIQALSSLLHLPCRTVRNVEDLYRLNALNYPAIRLETDRLRSQYTQELRTQVQRLMP